MGATARTLHLERSGPVRADAEGLFVPAVDLPGAHVGDRVIVHGHEDGVERSALSLIHI